MVRAGGGFNALVSSGEGADRGGNHLVDRLTVIIPASLVDPDDILEFTLDSEPVEPPIMQLNAERVIHGEIYKARPDVLAVCHHHSAAIMPFCISGDPVVPVFHLGAAMGPVAGTAATISATPISWWSSRRKAHRSPAHSEITPWC